jgi:glycerophosphoryl diester phosphodiesterase
MSPRPILLGHRGVRGRHYHVRENTIAAFDLALQHGCDGFEFDVRLSSDGRGVICHDARFAGSYIAKKKSAGLDSLPFLEQVLERYTQRAFLDIELKVTGLDSCLLSALSRHPPQHGYVVSSFLPEVLLPLRTGVKSLPLGVICETRRQLSAWPNLPVDYVIAKASLITQELANSVHASGRQLFCWTVNRKQAMLQMAAFGVDGIISDKPDLLAEAFAGSCVRG